jgi:hypothetical protein
VPLVIVQHDPEISDENLQGIKKLLKHSCAAALDCSATHPDGEGALVPDEINVRFWPYGQNDDREFALDVWIIAKHYPTRAEAIQGSAEAIRTDLCRSPFIEAGARVGVFPTCPIAGWAEGSA